MCLVFLLQNYNNSLKIASMFFIPLSTTLVKNSYTLKMFILLFYLQIQNMAFIFVKRI